MSRRSKRLGVTLFLQARRRLLLTDLGRSYAARIRLHLGRSSATRRKSAWPRRLCAAGGVVSTFCAAVLIRACRSLRRFRITLNLSVRSEVFA